MKDCYLGTHWFILTISYQPKQIWVAAIGVLANMVMLIDTTDRLIRLVSSGCVCSPTSGWRLRPYLTLMKIMSLERLTHFTELKNHRHVRLSSDTLVAVHCSDRKLWLLAFMCACDLNICSICQSTKYRTEMAWETCPNPRTLASLPNSPAPDQTEPSQSATEAPPPTTHTAGYCRRCWHVPLQHYRDHFNIRQVALILWLIAADVQ